MNYTENHHLPQWEETDRIMRKDFNQMCADMEAGLDENAAAAAAAQAAADNAQASAGNAQTAADNAQATADNAMEKANNAYAPDQKPYVVGSYIGAGYSIDVYIGFRPSFLIISGQTVETTSPPVFLATGDVGEVSKGQIVFFDTFMTVYPVEGFYPQINLPNRVYYFIAFR